MVKKLFSFVAAALMSASLFAGPAAVPTVQDVATAGFDLTSSRVIVLYFDEQVCNDIVWAGSYNEWSTTPDDMLTFEPLENYPGWYVVEVFDDSNPCQGRPVQLKKDGSFNWDFQAGDPDAWINMAQPGSKTATIVAGNFEGESNCTWPDLGVYIYEVEYFKNHNSPCGADKPKHNYTITAYLPDFCDEIGAYTDSARVMGGFDNWEEGVNMQKTSDEDFNMIWTATLNDVEEGTEFKLRFGTDADWAVQVRKDGQNLGNLSTGETTDIILRFDGEGYDFAACAGPAWPEDAPATAPAAPTVDGASILGTELTTSYTFEPLDWPGTMPQLLTFATGENIYYMSKMTWQIYTNWEEDSYDMSEYNMLHVDLYPATGTEIKVTIEALSAFDGGSGYEESVVKALTAGQWNGLDIALSEFPALASGEAYDFSDVKYFTLEGYNAEQSALTVGNVYFYSVPTALPTLFDDGVKANKFLHNGQLIIRKGEKNYNALGQEL